jgi:hypothetical protein
MIVFLVAVVVVVILIFIFLLHKVLVMMIIRSLQRYFMDKRCCLYMSLGLEIRSQPMGVVFDWIDGWWIDGWWWWSIGRGRAGTADYKTGNHQQQYSPTVVVVYQCHGSKG